MRKRKNSDDKLMFWIVAILFIGISLPFLGIYYLLKPNEDNKAKGILLLVSGILVWIIFMIIL